MRKLTVVVALLCFGSVAFAQGKKGKAPAKGGDPKNAPLYTLDTEKAKDPPAGSGLAAILKSHHVRVCVRSDVPPFGYFSRWGLKGLDIQLARAIVNQLSIDYKVVLAVDWSVVSAGRRVARLKAKSCDLLVATFSNTRARARQVGLSKVYLQTDKVLLASESPKAKAVIGRVRGTTGKAGGVKGKTRYFNTYQEIIYGMEAGDVDYVVADRPVAVHLQRSVNKKFKITKTLAKNAENYSIGVNKKHKALLDAVNKALTDLANSGQLALMYRRWL
ncbi:MAG: amino acid ABC transporter substrate-binding protein [Myxococcales bacterium]|nr:amino acid ABC transporter substrate-binding protein [Myxococcales bacterium]